MTIFVPHYAMSGGTLLALACDQIVMDPNAVLGPVDPQIGPFAAASILEAVAQPVAAVSDQTLMMADMARKALAQVRGTVITILTIGGMERARAEALAETLATGTVTHDYPISFERAKALGSGQRRVPQRGARIDEPVRDADQPAAIGHVRAAADGRGRCSRTRPAWAAR